MRLLNAEDEHGNVVSLPAVQKEIPQIVNTNSHYDMIDLITHREGDDELTRSIPLVNGHICHIGQ